VDRPGGELAGGRADAGPEEDALGVSSRSSARKFRKSKIRQASIRNPIDAFVLAKLTEKGLALSPEADRRTLIRRLNFDLLGLPPTPEEIEAFVSDPGPEGLRGSWSIVCSLRRITGNAGRGIGWMWCALPRATVLR
jgi:hypothetical protein